MDYTVTQKNAKERQREYEYESYLIFFISEYISKSLIYFKHVFVFGRCWLKLLFIKDLGQSIGVGELI